MDGVTEGFNCGCGLRTFTGSRHHRTCPQASAGGIGPAHTSRVMACGPRSHRSASLRIVEPDLPEDMREGVREIVSLVSTDRGKGHAKALMHEVCAEADRAGKVLLLTPDVKNEERLRRFYGRHGFVVIQSAPCLMARQPQRPVVMHSPRYLGAGA